MKDKHGPSHCRDDIAILEARYAVNTTSDIRVIERVSDRMTVSIGLVLVSLLLPLGIGAFPSEGVQFVGEAGLNYVKVPIQAVTPVFEHSSHLKRQAKLRTWSWMNNASYSVRGTSTHPLSTG